LFLFFFEGTVRSVDARAAFFILCLSWAATPARWCVISTLPLSDAGMLGNEDFSVVMKHRALPPKSWRWEICRAGRASAIDHSEAYFDSITESSRAGKAALKLMLSERPD
jgi:hypothetical protein